ncbi:MAG: MFS transporter, partial [Polyangiaceae bacterium]
WSSTVWQAAAIAGPALGGVVYGASHGPAAVFACSAVLSLTAFSLVAALHVRTGRMELGAASLSTLFAGVKYVFKEKVVLGTISLDLFAVLLGGAVALLPIFARDILDVGPWGLGILRSAPALGAALMAVLLAFRPLKHKAGPIMLMAVGVFGVATIVFGMSRSFWLSLAALVVVGASDMVSVVIRSTLVQISTPPAMRGRVSAVNLVFVGASNELGEFESGITAAWLGAARAVIWGGIATCGVVAIWAQAFPALRRIDRLDEIRSPK